MAAGFRGTIFLDFSQPMETAPAAVRIGHCDVLLRGYIANRSDLDEAARNRGNAPATSDAELVVRAYQRWGHEFPRHVLGQFAVAIYDRVTSTLVLAHDEFGLVPLFYAETYHGIAFGTHLDDVVHSTDARTLDEEYIADYLAQGRHFGARTPYANIRRLAPAESVIWNAHGLVRHEIWSIREPERLHYRDAPEYEVHLHDLVAEAVRTALPAGGKTWCELSGGLDSSTVFSLASQMEPGDVEAFSFVYSQSARADERRWIGSILDAHPAPWHSIDGDEVRPFTEQPARDFPEPNLSLLTTSHHDRYNALLAANGVGTVLTGMGGDAVFFGDSPKPYYVADLLLGGQFRQLSAELGRWSRASHERRPALFFLSRYGLAPLAHYFRRELIESPHVNIPWVTPRFAERMQLSRRGRASRIPRLGSVASTAFYEGVTRTAYSIAMRYQRESPAEFRDPLMYRPLVAFMNAVPWKHKLHPECDRLLQRRAFQDLLPERTILRRTKAGPDQAFYLGLESSPEWRERLTSNPRLVELGYVDAHAWRLAVDGACVGQTIGLRYFLATVTLEAWLQGFWVRSRHV